MKSLPPVRRIVTGHTKAGVAKAIIEGEATNAKFSASGAVSVLIWSTAECPSDIGIGEDIEDNGARILGTPPPPHGSRFCVIDLPPRTRSAMHRTETIDYVIVIAGAVEMEMDDSTVAMKAGDVMVQRGTNHSWINNTDEPARVAFVLMDARPLGIGHAVQGSHSAQ